MKIYKIVVGPLETNCYIVTRSPASRECVIIDPGDEPEKILKVIEENNLKPTAILLTHTHPDHTGAIKPLLNCLTGLILVDAIKRQPLSFGKIIKTPGHTPDSVCFVAEDLPSEASAKEGRIFTGDTLFAGGIGRTDLPGGNYQQIQESLKRLMEYPDHYQIHPGHGPDSTIGAEKQSNPFIKP